MRNKSDNRKTPRRSFIRTITGAAALYLLLLIVTLSVIARSTSLALKESASNVLMQTAGSSTSVLDQIFTAHERALSTLLQHQTDLNSLSDRNGIKSSVAAQNILREMENLTYANEDIQELIVYDFESETYLEKHTTAFSYVDIDKIREYFISQVIETDTTSRRDWYPVSANGRNFFVQYYLNRKRMLAAVIPVDRWINRIGVPENAAVAAVSRQGELIGLKDAGGVFSDIMPEELLTYASGKVGTDWTYDRKLLVNVQSIAGGTVTLLTGMQAGTVQGNFGTAQMLILFLVITAILMVVLLALYANRVLLVPFKNLLEAMERIVQGEQDYRLPSNAQTREFETVQNSFNYMMDTIVNLRLKSYEDRIQFDEATLKYVQLQIRPHFFLNALTTIHSMSFQNRGEEIREYIEYLSRNVRYLFKAGLHTVPLSEEITHVRDYIAMQNMLYPDCVFDFIDIDPSVSDYQVPQLLLHTMLENTYKHAVAVDTLTSILIHAQEENYKGEIMCHITVEDDGTGYPEEFLEQMEQGNVKVREDGHGIGLWNLKTTLSLMYRRDDLISFSNREPHGSRADMWIPRRAQRQSSVWKL